MLDRAENSEAGAPIDRTPRWAQVVVARVVLARQIHRHRVVAAAPIVVERLDPLPTDSTGEERVRRLDGEVGSGVRAGDCCHAPRLSRAVELERRPNIHASAKIVGRKLGDSLGVGTYTGYRSRYNCLVARFRTAAVETRAGTAGSLKVGGEPRYPVAPLARACGGG